MSQISTKRSDHIRTKRTDQIRKTKASGGRRKAKLATPAVHGASHGA